MVEDKLFSGESINVEYKVEVPKKSENQTNFGQTLIFVLLYAKLLPVTKTRKTRSYKGFADFRRKPNTYGI